jgi:hypothetical protein
VSRCKELKTREIHRRKRGVGGYDGRPQDGGLRQTGPFYSDLGPRDEKIPFIRERINLWREAFRGSAYDGAEELATSKEDTATLPETRRSATHVCGRGSPLAHSPFDLTHVGQTGTPVHRRKVKQHFLARIIAGEYAYENVSILAKIKDSEPQRSVKIKQTRKARTHTGLPLRTPAMQTIDLKSLEQSADAELHEALSWVIDSSKCVTLLRGIRVEAFHKHEYGGV